MFGVDVNSLPQQYTPEITYPDTVIGRILHIDGDFLAYQVSGDNSKSLDTMIHNHDVLVETLRLLAGAEYTVSHLTSSKGDKGGRYKIAKQKKYQANREGREKPEKLAEIKYFMEKERGAINHKDQEADDGLCQALWKSNTEGNKDLCIITSKDKDLRMCTGLHLNWDTGDIIDVDGYGSIYLDSTGSSSKIGGYGTSYFWSQMLTGDTADNIQGLPALVPPLLNKYKPTASTTKWESKLIDPKTSNAEKMKCLDRLKNRKPSKCGAVLAHSILRDCKSDIEALKVVKQAYKLYGDHVGFTNYLGEPVSWQEVFKSEANLLWMRRTKNTWDVNNFIKGVLSGKT